MCGKINFRNASELGEFLKAFTGSTALYEVRPDGADGYVLHFTGGF